MHIKKLINDLKSAGFKKPKYEEEVSNTYPLSILEKWKKFKERTFHRYKDIPKTTAKIYFHTPFCSGKCRFCFYNSSPSNNFRREYIALVKKDIRITKKILSGNIKASSFYFGGGTPTVLSVKQLSAYLALAKESFELLPNYIWTVETSPETATEEKIALLKKIGVNRISMGVQCLNDEVLKFVNRAHTSEQAIKSIKRIMSYNFDIFNVDLIYGMPKQTLINWIETVTKLARMKVPEFTLYRLRFNKTSKLDKRASLQKELAMFAKGKEILENNGYIRVRPTHWIRKKYYKTWKAYGAAPTTDQITTKKKGLVLGFGVSSVSQIGDYLFCKQPNLLKYKKSVTNNKIPGYSQYILSNHDKVARYFINKLVQGFEVDKSLLDTYFNGKLPRDFQKKLEAFEKIGLIKNTKSSYIMTEKGLLVYDFLERELARKGTLN